jgi:hypothetical protein
LYCADDSECSPMACPAGTLRCTLADEMRQCECRPHPNVACGRDDDADCTLKNGELGRCHEQRCLSKHECKRVCAELARKQYADCEPGMREDCKRTERMVRTGCFLDLCDADD